MHPWKVAEDWTRLFVINVGHDGQMWSMRFYSNGKREEIFIYLDGLHGNFDDKGFYVAYESRPDLMLI